MAGLSRWSAPLTEAFRHVFRSVRRSPAFTGVVALTLGLGIGANATIFGVVDRLLLRPPSHVEAPGQIRRIFVNRNLFGRTATTPSLSYAEFLDLQEAAALKATAAFSSGPQTLGHGATATRVRASLATASFFPLLGVRAAAGRFFGVAEDQVGAAGTAVISYAFWQQQFGGAATVLGEVLDVGNGSFTVIGVAPRGFTGVNLEPVDIWLPLHAGVRSIYATDRWRISRGSSWMNGIVRLRRGVDPASAEVEATLLHRRGWEGEGSYDPNASITLGPVIAARGPDAPEEAVVSRWLAGVSMIVLIIACANVANLLLVRGIRRRHEIAVRVALGMSRRRFAAELLLESVVLGLFGGASALLMVLWGGSLLRSVLIPEVLWVEAAVNARVLVFALVVSLLAGLLAGCVPAIGAARRDLTLAVREGHRSVSGRQSRMTHALLVAQIALSVVLLIGAGLFVRSLRNVQEMDLGLEAEGLFAVQLELERTTSGLSEYNRLFREAEERLRTVPGVQHVSASMTMPFATSFGERLRVPGLDSLPVLSTGGPYVNAVGQEYFETAGMRIVQGRGFMSGDTEGAPWVAVVEETMARLLWPGEDALGKCLLIGGGDPPCARVVGVVADSRRRSIIEAETIQYFVPFEQRIIDGPAIALYVRSAVEPTSLVAQTRSALHALSASIRFVQVRPLSNFIDPQKRSWVLGATMFTIYGGLAVVVAAIGLYSVLAFGVAQRRHEIGIRAVLGARPKGLVWMVVRRAVVLAAVGSLFGLGIALTARSAITDLLFQVSPTDPVVYGTVIGAMLAVAVLASSMPAWRAARVDPREPLRAE